MFETYLIVFLMFIFVPLIIAVITITHDKWLVLYVIFIFILMLVSTTALFFS